MGTIVAHKTSSQQNILKYDTKKSIEWAVDEFLPASNSEGVENLCTLGETTQSASTGEKFGADQLTHRWPSQHG